MNEASGGDGIPAELFQILNDEAVTVLHSVCQQILKIQQWPQDWKRSVFIPVMKMENAKGCSNYYTIAFIPLTRLCLKSFKIGFSSAWTKKFQMFKLDLEKAGESEIKLLASVGS